MNLLPRLCRLSCFHGLGCRPSIGIGSVHGVPSCSPSGSPAAGATKDSRWVILNELVRRKNDAVVADAKTMAAESPTSTGYHLRIYFSHAAPPASSSLYYDWAGSAPGAQEYAGEPEIIAAHADSVLFQIKQRLRGSSHHTSDYFVYSTSAAKPPTLSPIPAIPSELVEPHRCNINMWSTGLLRCGEDELMVVHLDLMTDRPRETAYLYVLRFSRREWELKPAVPIVVDEGGTSNEPVQNQMPQTTDVAVPVGDRFMCWADYNRSGLLLCDMAEASPKLRYMPLPVIPHGGYGYYDDGYVPDKEHSRKICAAGANSLRFVSIDPRCCCGHSPSRSSCPHGRVSFTVTTWTLTLRTDKAMKWVKESTIDCEEIWALPGYKGLPRVHPEFPVLSSADPDVVCFMVHDEKRKTWVVEFDTRSKTLLSVIRGYVEPRSLPANLRC
ncbi:hypothetical protein ACP70R_004021 [Stipagrostis hirtigluma subsp. patula]